MIIPDFGNTEVEAPAAPSHELVQSALLESGLSRATRVAYSHWISRLQVHCAKVNPREIEIADVDAFLVHLQAKDNAPLQTLRVARSACRFLLKACGNPKAGVLNRLVPLEGAAEEPTYFDDPLLWRALQVGRIRNRALGAVLYGCGIQLNEVAILRVSDLDVGRMQLQVQGRGPKKSRIVPLDARDLDTWVKYLKVRARLFAYDSNLLDRRTQGRDPFTGKSGRRWLQEPLFPSSFVSNSGIKARRRPLSPRQTQNLIEELARATRLPISPRNLRASYAVRELSGGILSQTVASRMGMTNPRSIHRYIWLVSGKQYERITRTS